MKPLISKCSMMPAWHQLVPISGHVEESETARKLQLYATSIKTSVSTRLYINWSPFQRNIIIVFQTTLQSWPRLVQYWYPIGSIVAYLTLILYQDYLLMDPTMDQHWHKIFFILKVYLNKYQIIWAIQVIYFLLLRLVWYNMVYYYWNNVVVGKFVAQITRSRFIKWEMMNILV